MQGTGTPLDGIARRAAAGRAAVGEAVRTLVRAGIEGVSAAARAGLTRSPANTAAPTPMRCNASRRAFRVESFLPEDRFVIPSPERVARLVGIWYGAVDHGSCVGVQPERYYARIGLDTELCGGVYKTAIGSDHVIDQLEPAVIGKRIESGCDSDGIAKRDNFMKFQGGLLIAEEVGPKMYPVDMLWLVK